MKNFQLIGRGLDMVPLHHALIRQPGLWNRHAFRRTYENTPHSEVDDIWLRYSDENRTADPRDTAAVQNDHSAVWYPEAAKLPEAKKLVMDLMHYLGAYALERLVISRLAPAKRILPHADAVGDYVHLRDIARYHIVVQGLPGSMFHCGDETVNMQTGEIWWFSAHETHSVENNSADDRVHLMADLRQWPC
jgi:hypothetical protein